MCTANKIHKNIILTDNKNKLKKLQNVIIIFSVFFKITFMYYYNYYYITRSVCTK